MNEEHEYFSETGVLPPLTATIERKNDLIYECGKCKAEVILVKKKPDVYQYECSACGHIGMVTQYDYDGWFDRQTVNVPD